MKFKPILKIEIATNKGISKETKFANEIEVTKVFSKKTIRQTIVQMVELITLNSEAAAQSDDFFTCVRFISK